ncbi:MAG: hypothetical protein AAGI72_21280 [Pseudomonadota bacterium]
MNGISTALWGGFSRGAFAVLVLLAFGDQPVHAAGKGAVSLTPLPSPAPQGSQLSRLTRDRDGSVYLSWVAEEGDVAHLQYARLRGERWSEPTTISQGRDWFVNWADFPVLSVSDGAMVAHWLSRSGSGTYDYDISARFYDPSAAAWTAMVPINNDGIGAEHGFVSMLPTRGHTLIAWLDGRNTRSEPEPGPMSLRAALFDHGGQRVNEWELDARVCDCCQTAAAMTDLGPVVVYRDRSPREIRDIAIVRLVDGQWSPPRTVGHDNWRVQGCPVNGPAVAAEGRQVVVAWFSAKREAPRVQLAISRDSGATFAAPVLVAGVNTNGRVDVSILNSGEIVVSWMESDGGAEQDARVMLSRFAADGTFLDATEVAPTSASRRSGFPTIESVENDVFVSWTDVEADARVRVARVAYGRGP